MNGDPDSWDESETNDHVPPCPGFDRMVQENELRIFLYDGSAGRVPARAG